MKKIISIMALSVPIIMSGQSYFRQFDHNSMDRTSERVMQYTPTSGGYIYCKNGDNLYTRALYGGNSAFRIETSDRPIFGAFHGKDNRNVHFIVTVNGRAMRLDSVAECRSYYRGGERRYELTDPNWGKGRISIIALAPRHYEGGIWKIEASDMPKDSQIMGVCVPTVKIKLSRNGDMGADPANVFAPNQDSEPLSTPEITIGGKRTTLFIGYEDKKLDTADQKRLAEEFSKAESQRDDLAAILDINTPDPYFNVLGPVIAHAADGTWDGKTWQHGAIGWRMPLSGWRGAYSGDFLGWHDRARTHFNAYAKSQVDSVAPVYPHPTQDPDKNMARAEKKWGTQMYSNGYICRNPERNDQMHHYDMNLCYIDELLWHMKWTGDLDYARTMWPTLKAHLEWEKRNFDPNDDGLYDAYCCIWASDALYYNSGAVTHSSAYNYRANKIAAEIAEKIGEDPSPYQKEADKILNALNSTLWMEDKGVWAEHQDYMGLKRLHDHPALWTVYHAIDSDVADDFMAYSATRYIDNNIPHIPVTAPGLEEGYATIATTDWMPYAWSINNVAFAEVMHTALAYWQAGRANEAARLLKSSMLDGMFLGISPGNIGQISHYDAARGECYRDFADPTAMMARAVVQGLFGFAPDALNHTVSLRPGFPSEWNHASIKHQDFSFDFERNGKKDIYKFNVGLDSIKMAELILPALTNKVKYLTINGKKHNWNVFETAVGRPMLMVKTPLTGDMTLEITWSGKPIDEAKVASTGKERLGFREVKSGDFTWWEETESFKHATPDIAALGIDLGVTGYDKYETIDLSGIFNANITDIFRNRYESPRSPYTTLQIPIQGIGEWCHPEDTAHIDDSGLRRMADESGVIRTSVGIPFATVKDGKNIAYTSLFDNYPEKVSVPLNGRANGIQLLLAGSTNHMQVYMENAKVIVRYEDGTEETLPLIAPYNWCPIEQDYYIDGKQFRLDTPRPYRMIFKDGTVTNDVEGALDINGVYGRRIDGGAGVLLRINPDPAKELKELELETLSNDVVVGLAGATYVR
ncbi:MAG: DUF4450 domain-containing protein [Muribaculaceae bacterium]|nr:DUF4450 domain-containing protein [Muribaculaceae bacterium]